MTLGGHLVELRKRLFIAGIALLLGTIVGFVISEYIWDALRSPVLVIAKQHNASINYTNISEAFDLRLQIAFYAGLLLSAPVWLYQIWAFIVPGLTKRERAYSFGFFFAAVPLFFGGCYAGWLVWPHIVELMASFVPSEDSSFYSARYYFDFVLKLILVVGVGFVLPVFVVLLNFVGVISARSIIRAWRWAIIAITVFTALATPAADVFSMFLLAIPMVVLYFASWFVAWIHDRQVARKQDVLSAELAV
ncbi:twin-arginine translocase subunit TatC [Amnibacterium flavum]|uniref:Sec-independent protein translocase protein TatC n=1 Tax=Amnibacterium flavum TaxID=2173173 RepID=A0A2V1HPT9_9MICO|nr:twin-arginine translocase subunit TatC [Amnibacterium flavum]PVZ94616.1 twin-arginine translocase subunit TatC [Amnibacterium flavum]